MAERTEETEVNNIIFCYKIGITHTAIWTKQKDQWSIAIPDHFKMCISFETPDGFLYGEKMLRADQIRELVNRRIKEKADEQKRTGKHYPMQITEKKEKARSRRR